MVEYFVYTLSALISSGYIIAALILLILLPAVPAKRMIAKEWLNISNLLVLLPIGTFLFQAVNAIASTFIIGDPDYLGDNRFTINNSYIFFHWITAGLSLLLFTLLLFKRFRQSVAITVLALLFLNSEMIFQILTDIYQGLVPTFWIIYFRLHRWMTGVIGFLIFSLLAALIYFGKRYFAGRVVKPN